MDLSTEAVIFTDCADLHEFICHIKEVVELCWNAMKTARLIWQARGKKIVNEWLGRITYIEENLMEIQDWQSEHSPRGSNMVQTWKIRVTFSDTLLASNEVLYPRQWSSLSQAAHQRSNWYVRANLGFQTSYNCNGETHCCINIIMQSWI